MKPTGSLALALVLNIPTYATQLLQQHKWGVLAEIQGSRAHARPPCQSSTAYLVVESSTRGIRYKTFYLLILFLFCQNPQGLSII